MSSSLEVQLGTKISTICKEKFKLVYIKVIQYIHDLTQKDMINAFDTLSAFSVPLITTLLGMLCLGYFFRDKILFCLTKWQNTTNICNSGSLCHVAHFWTTLIRYCSWTCDYECLFSAHNCTVHTSLIHTATYWNTSDNVHIPWLSWSLNITDVHRTRKVLGQCCWNYGHRIDRSQPEANVRVYKWQI